MVEAFRAVHPHHLTLAVKKLARKATIYERYSLNHGTKSVRILRL